MRGGDAKSLCRGRWAAGAALLLGLVTAAVLAVDQGAPAGQYTYTPRPDGTQYRMTRSLDDPAVPPRVVAVVKFISDLGYVPQPTLDYSFTWRWRNSKLTPDKFEFNEGHFSAYSASAPDGQKLLKIGIDAGIGDPGYEIQPMNAGSQALVDGSSHPGRAEMTLGADRFVPLPGKSGIWFGSAMNGARAVLSCGAVKISTLGPNPYIKMNLTAEQRHAEVLSYHSAITPFLTGLHTKLCDAGICRCAGGTSTVELFDGNPSFNGKYDFTDPKAIRNFLNRQDWIAGAHTKAVIARETRKGAVADGVSLLILRSEVPSTGKVVFRLPGFPMDGRLYRIEDGAVAGPGSAEIRTGTYDDEEAGRKRHWAMALYLPPTFFGAGGAERRVRVDLSVTSAAGTESKGGGEITLIRPPVVLVHGTFDNPEYCWNTKDLAEATTTMRARLESEGFRVFLTDWRETNGQKDPSSLFHNRRAVWQNRGGIKEALESVRRERFAVTQADVVAHSQGGLLARMWARGRWGEDTLKDDDYHFTSPRDCAETCEYHRPDNFAAGDIHRLITISTTHYGSDICRLFETYRGLVDNRQISDPGLGAWDSLRTEAILALHPQREAEPYAFPTTATLLPWTIDKLLNVGYFSMIDAAIGKKLDFLRDYTFTQGFRDQIPGSDGLRRIMKTRVPAHAIACFADDQAMLTQNKGYYQQRLNKLWILSSQELLGAAFRKLGQEEDAQDLVRRKENEWQMVLKIYDLRRLIALGDLRAGEEMTAMVQRLGEAINADAARLRSAAFGNSDNDCTVRRESAYGGLDELFRTGIHDVLHGPAPQYPAVQQRVVELLKDSGRAFAPDGFPAAGELPPARTYTGPAAAAAGSLYAPSTPGGALRRGSDAPKPDPAVSRTEPPAPKPQEPKPAVQGARDTSPVPSGPAVLAANGTMRLTLVGSEMRVEGERIVVSRVGEPAAPGAPILLQTGAVLRAVFSLEDGRELSARGLSLEALARVLNADSAGSVVVLQFVLPDGEAVDIPHPGRLPPRK